ncbi:class I SAM-dependent methyltransferase [Amycolatopsis cynarae]|uniref:Class I SAM-dependent methyltransferase n=1 Tax=Amycolatopsis cynarae TaxID=2995223 RepID=A0ABY7BAS2_9PSEU|nr:class I SAM-dependent methyltransferase [Amycolatopsis sp. HUAS 11-8]WAL69065.1 class I SAM-dependent methyltransferase [Amycolatopsis sp. HUAS 11-8]
MSDWLSDTRLSYDTVASSYADRMRGALAGKPLLRGVLAMFAEAVLARGGPVADLGCGPGHITAHLRDKGLDAFGIDLSPAMIEIARRDHPGLRFGVGSMTDLVLPDRSVGGVVAFFSLIHVPDEEVPVALAQFHRVLRPGGVVLLGFHVGDEYRLKTEGYGGHPMKVRVHWRPVDRMAAWVRDAGLVVDARVVLEPDAPVPAGILLAHRP